MAAPGVLISFSAGQIIRSSDVNSDLNTLRNSLLTAVFKDTNTTITGTMTWTVNQVFQSGIAVSGAATFSSGITVGATISGTPTFTSAVNFGATVSVVGATTLSGGVTVTGAVVASTGTFSAGVTCNTLSVSANATLNAALNVVGNIVVTGNLTVGGSFLPVRAWPTGTSVANPGLSFNAFQDTGVHALLSASSVNVLNLVAAASVAIAIDTSSLSPNITMQCPVIIGAGQGLTVGTSANAVVGATLVTSATVGYLYIPTFPSTGTGVPKTQAGTVAIAYETGGNHIMVYNGAWRAVAVV